MNRSLVRSLVAVAVLGAACSFPTDTCACTPARFAVVVAGRMTDPLDGAVVGARVVLDGVPPTMSAEPPIIFDQPAVTDASGSFVTRAYSLHGEGRLALRAAVVKAGTTDTIMLRVGSATFRRTSATLDTVHLQFEVP